MKPQDTAVVAPPHITELRGHLMAALAALRDRDTPMEPDRARAMAQVGSVLIDSAKVEIEYLKTTGQDRSDFLETPPDAGPLQLGNGITSITRHRL